MSDTVKLDPSNPCPKCGAPIPAGAPQGLCPKCVLLGAATATDTGVPATATSEIPSLARVAAAFPQLEILELIGRGGMGFVFKARQPHLDRFVALKLLPDKLARDPRFTERFNREGRVLAKLNHPNIVSVYDFGQTEHFYFLLMEFVNGVNLRQAMKAGRFSPGEALAIVPKICEALQYAHGQGILHRDIKPENILLDARGQVKIADFGIAKLVGDDKPDVTLTATGAALGTPHYMAPEQLEQPLTVDHRADIYSLGVVFYEMLTGELPIGRFAAPSSKTPVGANVDEVVFRTLEKDRERRYQSAGEMKTQVEHLTEAGAGNYQAAPPVPPPVLSSTSFHRHWARTLGWAVAALLLVNFFAPHITRLGNSPADTITIGLTTPWLVNLPLVSDDSAIRREYRFNFHSSAFYSGIFGVLLAVGLMAFWRPTEATGRGPDGTRAINSGAAPPVLAAWSQKAVWGAVLTGLSLPMSVPFAGLAYMSAGGIGGWVLLATGAICLPGLAGCILGWMGLSDIRAHQGRLRGLPLAVFAALAWPLLVLVGATLIIPWLMAHRGAPTPMMLLVPVGTTTFAIWAVYAAVRWGANKPASQRQSLLKWVLTSLFIGALFGPSFLRHAFRPAAPDSSTPLPEGMVELVALSSHPSDGMWWRPDGTPSNEGPFGNTSASLQVGPGQRAVQFVFRSRDLEREDSSRTYVIMGTSGWVGGGAPRSQGRPVRGGSFVAATFADSLRETTVRVGVAIDPWETVARDTANASRSFSLTREKQPRKVRFLGAIEGRGGDLILTLTHDYDGEDFRVLAVDAKGQERANVTRTFDGNRHSFSFASLTLENVREFRFQVRPYRWAEFNNVQLEPAKSAPVRAPLDGTTTAPWIRFTFTAVELREVAGVRWLAVDYVDDVHGDCQKSFPWETTIPGFKAETRATEFVTDAKDSSPAVRHQRIEYRMPDSSPRDQLERLRDNLEKTLKQKSFRLELGENEMPLLLFELPGAEGGSLKARIKVMPPLEDTMRQSAATDAEQKVAKQSGTPSNNSNKTFSISVTGAPPLSYQWRASDSKLVIDVWPGAYPAGVTPQPDKLSWKFKCLIPPGHLAHILFVRWTNGVPAIQQNQSAYYKVGAAPAEIDLHLSYDKHGSSQPAKERSQWNVYLGRGATMSTFLPEEPAYVPLNTPGRMTVGSGRQRSVPLVDFADPSRLPGRGQNGIDLRILLMPLKSPAIRAVPTEQDHGNYISGMGLAVTMEDALKSLKELPTDP